ncbi:hypothetical protein [Clostridium merdae]|uniref:hypothetical protein n=1 Tax=Clostridium merdae TaxID=1958780 RepID=UPI001FA8CC83|nr:hypothetical protein [Clostridium merdae]
MSARYMKKSSGVSRGWVILCLLLAAVVGAIVFFWVTQGRAPFSPASSQVGSQPAASSVSEILSGAESAASQSASLSSVSGEAVVYTNQELGFSFALPPEYEEYSILTGEWKGDDIKNTGKKARTFRGPQVTIRDPRWTQQVPRQDIPIMAFTLEQWNQLQNGEFAVGAAPVNPSELGRNTKYVFALPARYNYAFPEGYEEVQIILDGNPLTAF